MKDSVSRPLVIFDFDGTLANSIDIGIQLANKYATKYKYTPLENFEDVRKQSAVNYIFSNIKWYYIPFWAIQMKRELKNAADHIPLYKGVQNTLLKLSEITDLAIISGGNPSYIKRILSNNLYNSRLG